MTIAASVALLRFKMPIVPVLALSGAMGLIVHAIQA
jgi:xanthosine utilization system XapX-like protein